MEPKYASMWSHGSALKTGAICCWHAIFLVTFVRGGESWFGIPTSIEGVLTTITDENLVAFQSAESLEIALVNQEGICFLLFSGRQPGLAGPTGKVPPGIPGTAGPGPRIGPVSNELKGDRCNRIADDYDRLYPGKGSRSSPTI
jgi:hypothetical protein